MPVVYFVERCMYKARINHLRMLAKKLKEFTVSDTYNNNVTHVIAQETNKNEVLEYLRKRMKDDQTLFQTCIEKQLFLDVSWFIECMKAKKVVPVVDAHLLHFVNEEVESSPAKKMKFDQETKLPMYACQRSTPLNHKNNIFTDALEILEEHALYRGDVNAEARSLAFRRGSSTLKCLRHRISDENELSNLPHIDFNNASKPGHCKRVIKDILANGYSTEVEDITSGEFYTTMKLFCGIFGVGPQTARKWFYDYKLRTLDDVRNCAAVRLNRDQSHGEKNIYTFVDIIVGLQHYEDLNSPVTLEEAKEVESLIRSVALKIQEGIEITLVGGFRRGKKTGHDIDLLITHPTEGKEKILPQILLHLKDIFIYTDRKAGSTETPVQVKVSSTMDDFEKCYAILKVCKKVNDTKDWVARRVDLIVVPYSQFPFAVLGWSGTKHFEREIRRYAKTEKGIVLTSHGMYIIEGKTSIPASSEEDIFKLLGLDYQEPGNRNC